MEEKFDYTKALTELEEIAKKVENPETRLEEIDALVARSKAMIASCREYLRKEKETIDTLDKE